MEDTQQEKATFFATLKRTNTQIKQDRAQSIGEEAQITYKRHVEDLEMSLTRLKRKRANLLDMSPDNADSLLVASKFDASLFVKVDHDLGIEIYNLQKAYDLASARYIELFGKPNA